MDKLSALREQNVHYKSIRLASFSRLLCSLCSQSQPFANEFKCRLNTNPMPVCGPHAPSYMGVEIVRDIVRAPD